MEWVRWVEVEVGWAVDVYLVGWTRVGRGVEVYAVDNGYS